MRIVAINLSRKKAFRSSKRIIGSILPQITIRTNIGNIPRRVLLKLIKDLRAGANRGTCVKLFIETGVGGFHGFKCVEIGKRSIHLNSFVLCESSIDQDLRASGWLVEDPFEKPRKKKPNEINSLQNDE